MDKKKGKKKRKRRRVEALRTLKAVFGDQGLVPVGSGSFKVAFVPKVQSAAAAPVAFTVYGTTRAAPTTAYMMALREADFIRRVKDACPALGACYTNWATPLMTVPPAFRSRRVPFDLFTAVEMDLFEHAGARPLGVGPRWATARRVLHATVRLSEVIAAVGLVHADLKAENVGVQPVRAGDPDWLPAWADGPTRCRLVFFDGNGMRPRRKNATGPTTTGAERALRNHVGCTYFAPEEFRALREGTHDAEASAAPDVWRLAILFLFVLFDGRWSPYKTHLPRDEDAYVGAAAQCAEVLRRPDTCPTFGPLLLAMLHLDGSRRPSLAEVAADVAFADEAPERRAYWEARGGRRRGPVPFVLEPAADPWDQGAPGVQVPTSERLLAVARGHPRRAGLRQLAAMVSDAPRAFDKGMKEWLRLLRVQ